MENLPERVHNSPSVPTPSYTNIADGYQAALKVVDKSVVFWDHETNDISVVSSTLSAFLESLY